MDIFFGFGVHAVLVIGKMQSCSRAKAVREPRPLNTLPVASRLNDRKGFGFGKWYWNLKSTSCASGHARTPWGTLAHVLQFHQAFVCISIPIRVLSKTLLFLSILLFHHRSFISAESTKQYYSSLSGALINALKNQQWKNGEMKRCRGWGIMHFGQFFLGNALQSENRNLVDHLLHLMKVV